MERGFGEVFLAFNKSSNDLVAVKHLRLVSSEGSIENEAKMLQECTSKFIVRYYDAIRSGNELYVGTDSTNNE